MTDPAFREIVDAAIEARRPLDTPAFSRLAESASEADRRYWRAHARLDRAVADWQAKHAVPKVRTVTRAALVTAGLALKAWQGVRSAQTAATLALALSAVVIWSGRQTEPLEPLVANSPTEPVLTIDSEPIAPVPQDASSGASGGSSAPLALADPPAARGDFAEATETAERLAYAFQPVGEQVGSVVRLLIDAVPGSDVFSM